MQLATRLQLSVMMMLEYFIWGAWFVAMGIYLPAVLKADGAQVGLAYGNAWFGAMVSPFFIGMIADRYFSAQKVLGVLHLLGAVLLWYLAQTRDLAVFPWILLVYSCVYMPTVALTNSVAMGQSDNQERDFPTGMTFGSYFGGVVASMFAENGVRNWSGLWLVPAVIAAVILIVFLLLFKVQQKKA